MVIMIMPNENSGGFGRVDQLDAEQYDHFVKGAGSNVTEKVLYQPPVLV